MSGPARTSDRPGVRLRAVNDLIFGLVVFLLILTPAIRQAMKGTVEGLAAGMSLLLVDMVVLVLLARYITSPERRARSATRIPSATVLSPRQLASLLDERGLPVDLMGLELTEEGLSVRQGGLDALHVAHLAWPACAAVVVSEFTPRGGPPFAYLQFVATDERLIDWTPGQSWTSGVSKALGLTEAAAATVWLVQAPMVHLVPPVLRHLQTSHPEVRIVKPDGLEIDPGGQG